MRRCLLMFYLCFAMLLLSACAIQPPPPKTISVSEERLAYLIASQFPFDSTMLEVLDVHVKTPRITLDPVANRINTTLDLDVSGSGILGLLSKKNYGGRIDLSYGLRFEPNDRSVRMSGVQVHRFSVVGAPESLQRQIEQLGASLAQKLLKDYVLYKVRPEDLQTAEGWGYRPGEFRIIPGGLSITLDPIEPR